MTYHNQHSVRQPRDKKLPTIALNRDEHRAIMAACKHWRITIADAVRCSLYCAGAIAETAVEDMPPDLLEHMSRTHTITPPEK